MPAYTRVLAWRLSEFQQYAHARLIFIYSGGTDYFKDVQDNISNKVSGPARPGCKQTTHSACTEK